MILNKLLLKTKKFFIYDIIDFAINQENVENLTKTEKVKVFLHYLKSQPIIKIFFIAQIIILNIYSLLRYFKFLEKNTEQNRKIIYDKFQKYNFLKFKKVMELVLALVFLVKYNDEKLIKEKKNLLFKNKGHYENIVIGSGPGGAVTVNTLLKNKRKTLLIEKGYKTSIPKTKHPAQEFFHKWKYSGLSGSIGKFDLQYASAECYGGGSEINSGLYHPIDNLFIKKIVEKNLIENLSEFDDDWSEITSNDEKNKLNEKDQNLINYFDSGSRHLGWRYENVKKFYKSNGSQDKQSMSKTLLKEAENYGLEVLLNHGVKKIKKLNNHWEISFFNKNKKITCNNLFLCCGTPYTLNLLKRSGILPWRYNDNFHFHPMIKIVAKFPLKVNNKINKNVISSQITEFYPKYLFGNAASDIQFLNISAIGNADFRSCVEKDSEYMSILHSTFTNGKCSFLKIPFIDNPIITFNLSKKDFQIVKEGVFNLIKFAFKSGAEYVFLIDNQKTKISSFEEDKIKEILESAQINFSSVHLLGGINFGEKPENLFNSYGKCKNQKYSNLYVNDSSLISENLLKNPQGAIMSLAKRNILNFIAETKND